MMYRKSLQLAAAAVLAAANLSVAWAQTPAEPPPGKPVVAVVSAVGDRIGLVRQRPSTGSNISPYARRSVQVPGASLNMAVLKGLDEALELEEPEAERVLMGWNPPEELAQRLEKAAGDAREKLLLTEVLAFLEAMPERARWTRIELVVPYFAGLESRGMANRLTGVGIFVMPLKNGRVQVTGDGDIEDAPDSNAGTYSTVNPESGVKSPSATFVAPYFYFERLTLDARTLRILKRQRSFEHSKYSDPNSTAIDVAQQVSPRDMTDRLVNLVERAAYKSVRGQGQVEVGPAKAVQPPAKP